MTLIQFYQLSTSPLEKALPRLAEKAYSAGFRVHLRLPTPELVEYYNNALWTFAQDSFLPHGTANDASPEKQPVFLSATPDAPNEPNVLMVTDGAEPANANAYQRILDIFDGRNEDAVAQARARWKQYKEKGCEVSYFKQNDKGAWEKAA